jgi:hypothetical protein
MDFGPVNGQRLTNYVPQQPTRAALKATGRDSSRD